MSDIAKRYIGIVKSHDHIKNKAGIINNPEIGDVFFHEKNVAFLKRRYYPISIQNLVVIYSIKESEKEREKIEAVNIKKISEEGEWSLIIDYIILNLLLSETDSNVRLIINSLLTEIYSFYHGWLFNGRFNLDSFFYIYANHLKLIIPNTPDEKSILKYLNVGEKIFEKSIEKIEFYYWENFSLARCFQLWLDGKLKNIEQKTLSLQYIEAEDSLKDKIIERCSINELVLLLNGVICILEKFTTDRYLLSLENLQSIENKLGESFKSIVIKELFHICNDSCKLNLWINNYVDVFDFNSYKNMLFKATPEIQKLFIRKILYYIYLKKIELSIEDVLSISHIPNLDISFKTLLLFIGKLKDAKAFNSKETEESLYKLILNHISENKETGLIDITYFFDKCEGRCIVSQNQDLKRDVDNRPKFRNICDGRKALDKQTKQPILSQKEQKEFWWCENRPCFSPARKVHYENWMEYNIVDFLSILKIEYSEIHFEKALSLINKTSRFWEHLKCHNCSQFLTPQKQSNYAFHGITTYYCCNPDCIEKEKIIYLSHCLNGQCEMIIDSRNTTKCENGWYICNFCFACCTSRNLENRKRIIEYIGKEVYQGGIIGHKELNIISCPKCSGTINLIKNNPEYERVLDWLINNSDKSKRILKSGIRSDGKRWFIIGRNQDTSEQFRINIGKFVAIGFEAPNFNKESDRQLIAEPKHKQNSLRCESCQYTIDLEMKDSDQIRIVKKYHSL